jgi:Transposase domain (DUF772)
MLVYGYATGVFSSRKTAKKLHEDVAFRGLAPDNFPKHRTLSDFRALHLEEHSVHRHGSPPFAVSTSCTITSSPREPVATAAEICR